ncbi:hypothetical protein NC651_018582 [Populus alba x Populus x berolinensis]|nr:hypothetical protein NC651_018582 [Populus alba x Populus x berolinensis]
MVFLKKQMSCLQSTESQGVGTVHVFFFLLLLLFFSQGSSFRAFCRLN